MLLSGVATRASTLIGEELSVCEMCVPAGILASRAFLRYRFFSNLLILRATFEFNSVPGH